MIDTVFRPTVSTGDIGAVVFDLDGTLVDTEAAYRVAFETACAEIGWPLPPGLADDVVGLPSPSRRILLADRLGPAFPIDAFLSAYRRRRALSLAGAGRPMPGAAALLDRLDRLGLPRAVATSASLATATGHLTRSGLARRLDAVVTRDHVTRWKPAPDSFLRAAALLGVNPSDCLAIEDSGPGLASAVAAGMVVLAVPGPWIGRVELPAGCAGCVASLHDVGRLFDVAEPRFARHRSRSRV